MNAPHPLHVLHTVERQQGRELPHESARLHVTGEAVYIDDIPEVRGTLYAALVLSPVAHGELLGEGIDREAILREHGVVAVFTAADPSPASATTSASTMKRALTTKAAFSAWMWCWLRVAATAPTTPAR